MNTATSTPIYPSREKPRKGLAAAETRTPVVASTSERLSAAVAAIIERDIFREKGIHLVIHMDPVVTDDVRVEQLRRLVREVLAEAR